MGGKNFFSIIVFLTLFIGVTILVFTFQTEQQKKETHPVLKPETKKQSVETFSRPFELINWKLTLPITTPDNPTEPLEIRQPELATYQVSPWFKLTPDQKGLIFRAPVNAPTTVNSNYPRSELREMTADGKEEIFWSSIKGTHTFFLEEAIMAIPKNKPVVVTAQIHGDDSDLIVIRLEGEKLFLARSKENLATLDDNYLLGRRFNVKFVVKGGEIAVYYNNSATPIHTLAKKVNQAYFKAGVYTQSNCKTEEFPDLCSADNYGEVIIYQAKITHE